MRNGSLDDGPVGGSGRRRRSGTAGAARAASEEPGSESGSSEDGSPVRRRKTVSFPADGAIVSGTVDAPKPRFHEAAHFGELDSPT